MIYSKHNDSKSRELSQVTSTASRMARMAMKVPRNPPSETPHYEKKRKKGKGKEGLCKCSLQSAVNAIAGNTRMEVCSCKLSPMHCNYLRLASSMIPSHLLLFAFITDRPWVFRNSLPQTCK